MADSCVEGHRKRAKYLLGDAELGRSLPSRRSQRFLTLLGTPPDLLKRQKTGGATNDTSPLAQNQAPTPKAPSGMRNSTAVASFLVSPVRLQP